MPLEPPGMKLKNLHALVEGPSNCQDRNFRPGSLLRKIPKAGNHPPMGWVFIDPRYLRLEVLDPSHRDFHLKHRILAQARRGCLLTLLPRRSGKANCLILPLRTKAARHAMFPHRRQPRLQHPSLPGTHIWVVRQDANNPPKTPLMTSRQGEQKCCLDNNPHQRCEMFCNSLATHRSEPLLPENL